jgi:hypothetical protein
VGFADDANTARESHEEYFGDDNIEYRPTNADAFEDVKGIAHRERIEQRKTQYGVVRVITRSVFVFISRLSSPKMNGEIRIGGSGGNVYTIESILGPTAARWELKLTRANAVEVTRQNARRG